MDFSSSPPSPSGAPVMDAQNGSETTAAPPVPSGDSRLAYLDATRAFALLLGIVFHASLSFLPVFIGWAVQDVSTSPLVGMFVVVSHSFRMETFFLLAGFFGAATLQRTGARAFVRSRFVRIVIPFVVGWFILRPLIVSGWIMGSASLRGDYDFGSSLIAGFASLQSLPAGIFTGSHLWFLYYLAMITTTVLLVRALFSLGRGRADALLRRADAGLAWLARSRWWLPLLALPTAAALWYMRSWGMDTPDQSLRPHVPVTLIYGGFFLFGWMLNRQRRLIDTFARPTVGRWAVAIAAVAATILLSGIEGNPSHPYYATARVAHVTAYALMMWSLVFLTIGVFQRFCARPSAVIRYIADSSYWLYLVHLPIVVWLQVAFAELPIHWSLKLAGISLISLAVLLLSYDLLVRSTFIGRVLNGRRRERVLFRSRPRKILVEA